MTKKDTFGTTVSMLAENPQGTVSTPPPPPSVETKKKKGTHHSYDEYYKITPEEIDELQKEWRRNFGL